MDNPNTVKMLSDALEKAGLRSTRQRELVFSVLSSINTHPTADEVYARARERKASVSLATVYNCLETLAECGLVKAVNRDREPTRYCANLHEHAHFHDAQTGEVRDISLPAHFTEYLSTLLPDGYTLERVELNLIGKVSSKM